MSLPLTIFGNPVLRRAGAPIKAFDPSLAQLVSEMLETMRQYRGIGLAAQQIGQALQLAVIDITGVDDRPSTMTVAGRAVDPLTFMPLLLINATVETTKSKEIGNEGCLSFPGLRCDVPRSRRVKVTTHGLDGRPFQFEAGGLLAVAIQHEFDHLQGKLYIDYLTPEERRECKEQLAKIERGEALAKVPEEA
jgi:peptide deformylase